VTFDPTATDNLNPVHLAYLAAAVLLPIRLLIIARAGAEVPALHERAQKLLASGEGSLQAALRRGSNPYTDVAAELAMALESAKTAADFDANLERALGRTKRRSARSQALDAAGLLLLFGLLLTDTTSSALGPGSLEAASFLGLMLTLTVVARARLTRKLERTLRELAGLLRSQLGRTSPPGACAFCGSGVEPAEVRVEVDGAPQITMGSLCRNCGKIVAALKLSGASL
jgi:hypothetical protein